MGVWRVCEWSTVRTGEHAGSLGQAAAVSGFSKSAAQCLPQESVQPASPPQRTFVANQLQDGHGAGPVQQQQRHILRGQRAAQATTEQWADLRKQA